MSASKRSADPAAIEAEIERIRSLGIHALREEWARMFRRPAPPGLTKDILRRMIGYRIQEEAFGGLDPKIARMLEQLAKGGNVELNRRLKPGTVLVREYQGERHEVTITLDGYIWRETTFASLSAIAKAITGTSWNGRRFFGVLDRAGKKEAASPSLPKRTAAAATPTARKDGPGKGDAQVRSPSETRL